MKMQTLMMAAAGAAAVTLGTAAHAGSDTTYVGTGGALADADFDNNFNTVPGVTRFEIFVPDSGTIDSFLSVSLDIDHTWVGDLEIDLINKDSGTTVRLIDRPGEPATTFGNSDDLVGVYDFVSGGSPIPEDADPGGSGEVTPGEYGVSGPGALSDFEGLDVGGTWSLVITDNAAGDSGSLNGWSISMTTVPAPAALAMFGLAGIARRRRRA